MLTIKRASLLLTGTIATAVASIGAYLVATEYSRMEASQTVGYAVKAISTLNAATIEMSFERSIMQVGLALPTALPADFGKLLQQQRKKSDALFTELDGILKDVEIPGEAAFAEALRTKRAVVTAIRQAIDPDLARSEGERNQRDGRQIVRLKDTIAEMSELAAFIRPDTDQIPSRMLAHDLVMQRSWVIREYGGRERTYFAIATALGRPLSTTDLAEMNESHGRALQSWALLSRMSRNQLDPAVGAAIADLERIYFTDYKNLREQLKAASASGKYPVDFATYFARSSAALDAAQRIGTVAGEANVSLADAYKADARWSLVMIAIVSLLALALTGLVVRYFLVSIVGRITGLAAAMRDLAAGRIDTDVDKFVGSDEVGEMGKALAVFRDGAQARARLEAEAAERLKKEQERQVELERHTKGFIGTVTSAMERLGLQTDGLMTASSALANVAKSASASATSAKSATASATSGAHAVASAAEQLTASIKEISEQAHKSRAFVDQVARNAGRSDEEITALATAVQQIGSIVALIRGVAEQTNLLALNATIEAARAGEAGRGFAVVATEVKSLAEQTAKATEEIERQIGSIQHKTTTAVDAIRVITGKIGEMNALSESIAAAVMEQEAATTEIARTIHHAAEGNSAASDAAEAVTQAAEQTNAEANKLSQVSQNVSSVATEIEQAVKGFVALVQGDINERRQTNRTLATGEIKVTSGGRTFVAQVRDVSGSGLRVTTPLPLRSGDVVDLAGSGIVGKATVAWSNSTGVGFALTTGRAKLAA
jgi:methyl-accepting chemotaxis protein